MMPSPTQLLIVAAIVVVIFGGKRVVDIFSSAGESIKGFKEATKDVHDE